VENGFVKVRTSSPIRTRSRGQSRLLIGAAAFALACASPAKPGGMKPALEGRFAPEPTRSVNIQISGGQETFPMGRSKISNRGFTEALAAALDESGLLYAVVDRAGDYDLDVHIEQLRQPHFAWTMEVRLVTSWSLKRRDEREPTWTDVFATSYAAPFPVEFFGIKRLRLANEGAARSNIEAAIVELADHRDGDAGSWSSGRFQRMSGGGTWRRPT
jgi:hypothetical protein